MLKNPQRVDSISLQIELLKTELKQIEQIRDFLKKLPVGRKIYINLGGVMVESNYLEVEDFLSQKEREIKSLLLKLESFQPG